MTEGEKVVVDLDGNKPSFTETEIGYSLEHMEKVLGEIAQKMKRCKRVVDKDEIQGRLRSIVNMTRVIATSMFSKE